MRKLLTILWFILSVLWVMNANLLSVAEMVNNENLNLIMYFIVFLLVLALITLLYYFFQVLRSLFKRKFGLIFLFDIIAVVLSGILLYTFATFALTTVDFASSDSITVMTGLAFLSQVPKVLSSVSHLLFTLPVIVIVGTAYYIFHHERERTGENFTQQLKPSKKK